LHFGDEAAGLEQALAIGQGQRLEWQERLQCPLSAVR
jgi:hypothetical protein